MKFLHSELDLKPGDVVQVTLDGQANVMLMDQTNFELYKQGKAYRYYGGHAKQSPVRLAPPHSGRWNVVVDLGGYPGTVRAGVSVLEATEVTR